MRRLVRFASTVSVAVLAATSSAPAQVATERIIVNLNAPVFLTAPAGDTQRLFIVELPGVIKIYKNGSVLARPFLDIQSLVNSSTQEQGLFHLAFDPDFDTNGWFYVYYTTGAGAGASTIQRFTVSSDPDSADPATIHSVFEITQPTDGHNGGTIAFGPDGYLYLGLGESNQQDRAQDPLDLLGKMLRLDVHGDDFPGDPVQNYAVPPDNPFVGDAGVRDEIWAMGLRNPWRFGFDRLTDDLYIADVGFQSWEEVDFQPAGDPGGENYGWPFMEGAHCYTPPTGCDNGGLTYPIHEYPHDPPGCWSISGGFVYRGSAIPSMQGHYFFGDFCTGRIWTLRYEQGVLSDVTERTTEMVPVNGGFIWNVVSFGQDAAGELYVIMYGTAGAGAVFRIIPDPDAVDTPLPVGHEEAARITSYPNPFSGATHLQVRLERPTWLDVDVYSSSGRLIRRLHGGPAEAGVVPLEWKAVDERNRPLPAGVYFVRYRAGDVSGTHKVVRIP